MPILGPWARTRRVPRPRQPGVTAEVDGHRVAVGSAKLMAGQGVALGSLAAVGDGVDDARRGHGTLRRMRQDLGWAIG